MATISTKPNSGTYFLKPEIFKLVKNNDAVIVAIHQSDGTKLSTIQQWMKVGSSRLTEYKYLVIIANELGLSVDQIINKA